MATKTFDDRAPSTTTASSASESCTTAVPGKYGYVPPGSCNSYYNFNPSFEGNLAFAVLFGISTLTHLIQAIVYKKRYCWVVIMGAAWELGAFIIKTVGSHDQQQIQFSIYGTLLFLLAPLWINAFVYMTVARMIYFKLPDKKIWGVRAIKLGTLFIWLDIVCFLVQVGGGSLLSGNSSANLLRIGQHIYMAGIGVQLAFIVIFGSMTAWFYHLLMKLEGRNMGRIKYLIWTMFLVLILVVIRIIYRLVEFGPGVSEDNPILSNENYGFGLDAFPMLFALVLLNVIHPGIVLRGPDSDFPRLSRKEKKALKQQKKDEKLQRKAAKKALKNGNGYEMYDGVVEEEAAVESPPREDTRYEPYRQFSFQEHAQEQTQQQQEESYQHHSRRGSSRQGRHHHRRESSGRRSRSGHGSSQELMRP